MEDAQAAEEGASLDTSRWCSPGIVEGGPHGGVATPTVVAEVAATIALAFFIALALTLTFAAVVGGEGLPEDSMIVAEVGVVAGTVAMEGALSSRTQRPVPGPSSCPARSPRVRGRCRRCEGGERLRPSDEDLHMIELLDQVM
jgi:hypothetical protein